MMLSLEFAEGPLTILRMALVVPPSVPLMSVSPA